MKSCILAGLLSIGAVHPAFSQEPAPEPVIESDRAAQSDAPSRVARLSYADGTVSLAPAGTEEWAEAVLNRPLTDGDRVWVENGGRAELQMGSSTVHLDENTGFSFVDLSDEAVQMNLTEGSIVVRVRRKLQDERIEIDTPNAVISLLHPGEYHIRVNEAGDETVVRTRSGESQIVGERQTYTVRQGEQGVFKGAGELAANIERLDSRTAFENWANDRERQAEQSASSRYVSRDVIGHEDLDRHGEWIHEPEYGYVWRPIRVYSGWAPYRDGRWVWVSPWGWTWVDAAPWGFAPFHYGRWAHVRSRWCWVPGPIHVRPVYAPALVAWVGGPHASISVSFGPAIGWYPLGPREVYVPSYWYSRRYIHNVNYANTVIVNNIYIDRIYDGRRHGDYYYRRHPHAITAVRRDSFVSGGPVRNRLVEVNERTLREWRDDPRAPAIAPDRSSVLAGRRVEDRSMARVVQRDRELSARRAVPSRVSFDAERRAVEENGGRPIDRARLFGRSDERADQWSQGREARVDRGSSVIGNPAGAGARDRQVLSDRPERSGATVQQWRNRESPKETTQPRIYQDRPSQSRESGSRDSPRMNSFTPPSSEATVPQRSDVWQRERESRGRQDSSAGRGEERQRAPSGSIINERRRESPAPQRFESAGRPQQRVESMRSQEAPRQYSAPRESRVERSMPQSMPQQSPQSSRSGNDSGSRNSGARSEGRGQSHSRGGRER